MSHFLLLWYQAVLLDYNPIFLSFSISKLISIIHTWDLKTMKLPQTGMGPKKVEAADTLVWVLYDYLGG